MHNRLTNKYYFINKFDQDHINKQDKKTTIIYRNYTKKFDEKLILKIKNFCRIRSNKFLIADNIKLAIRLNLDGAYIPSFNKCYKHLSYSFKKNFILLGSAHNVKQMRIKEIQKVEAIFISSLFKNNKNYLGAKKFNLLSLLTNKKIIALGGISKKNLKELNLINCFGFAGISFFG